MLGGNALITRQSPTFRRGQRWVLRGFVVRKAAPTDAPEVNALLSEWFDWRPKSGRLRTVRRAIRNGEILVAQTDSEVIGFIHYVMHEDIIDGGLNTFISAFYVSSDYRNKGIGSHLLEEAISDSLSRGVVEIETSTIHSRAKRFYEKHHFKQTFGDIGEVFLELDINEYSKVKSGTGKKSLRP
jgi:GNAT superfamily N-acetyltransferase